MLPYFPRWPETETSLWWKVASSHLKSGSRSWRIWPLCRQKDRESSSHPILVYKDFFRSLSKRGNVTIWCHVHLSVSLAVPVGIKEPKLSRLLQEGHTGSFVPQTFPLFGRAGAWGRRLGPGCHLEPVRRWQHRTKDWIQFKELYVPTCSITFLVCLTFEGPQHGLKVGVSNWRGGCLEGESFLKPIQQSSGNFNGETIAPLGENRHCMYQGSLVN